MMKKRISTLLLALCLFLMSACALADTQDRAGNPIAIPDTVNTIVSLAPSITRVIVDVGLAERLVAVDTYSLGIEGVPAEVAAFDMMVPDVEQLVALFPDVVLVSSMMLVDGDDPLKTLSDLGICVAYIPSSNSIADILADVLFIGQVTGAPEAAQALCDTFTAAMDSLPAETDVPVSVYFEISSLPSLYSLGNDTFLNEMITLLGGQNIFEDQTGWLVASEEAIIAANPEIIFTNEDWLEGAVDNILARAGWENISAVQNGRVYLINSDASSQPNHRIMEALEQMAEAFRVQ